MQQVGAAVSVTLTGVLVGLFGPTWSCVMLAALALLSTGLLTLVERDPTPASAGQPEPKSPRQDVEAPSRPATASKQVSEDMEQQLQADDKEETPGCGSAAAQDEEARNDVIEVTEVTYEVNLTLGQRRGAQAEAP